MGKTAAPRRIAILGSRGFPSTYGGYETLVRYLARSWVDRGLDVTVYCREKPGEAGEWTDEGVTCRWTPGRESKSLSTLSFGLSSHFDASRRGFDAALVLNVANGFFLPALRARGIATAVNTDGIEWERGKWGPTAKRVFLAGARATARFADVLIADSRAIGDIWLETFGVRSTFIPSGAPVLHGTGSDRVRELDLDPGSYALVVARVIPENNLELILDALERVSPPVPAVIVGSANYDEPIERRLRTLEGRGAVRWLGHVSDQTLLTQLWAHCGVYLHGHSVGGTNPALLQALGAGAPTLALETVFNREVIARDEQLFPADPVALAPMISAVIGDDARRGEMARHGRARVAAEYDWDRVSERYFAALCDACEARLGRIAKRPTLLAPTK
jgi:glycosyltransferase involved in cell wall biosynthesis